LVSDGTLHDSESYWPIFNHLCTAFAEKMMERDYFMTSEEAVSFGLIDKVLEKRAPGKGPEV
jgi:hypothetical protein